MQLELQFLAYEGAVFVGLAGICLVVALASYGLYRFFGRR